MELAGSLLVFVIPVVGGALAWLFWREWITSDRFWIAVVAVVVAGAVWHAGEPRIAVAIAAAGIGVWLWLERRDDQGD
jgi:hypothetical protein